MCNRYKALFAKVPRPTVPSSEHLAQEKAELELEHREKPRRTERPSSEETIASRSDFARNITHEKASLDTKETHQQINALRTGPPVDKRVPSELTQERQLIIPGGRRERHHQGDGVRPGSETGVQSFLLRTRHYSLNKILIF